MTAPSKVVIGPWNHSGPDCETPGPSLAREHLTVRWCDYWLKGIANGIMDEPDINVYVQTFDVPDAKRTHTSGYWRTEPEFPILGGVYGGSSSVANSYRTISSRITMSTSTDRPWA